MRRDLNTRTKMFLAADSTVQSKVLIEYCRQTDLVRGCVERMKRRCRPRQKLRTSTPPRRHRSAAADWARQWRGSQHDQSCHSSEAAARHSARLSSCPTSARPSPPGRLDTLFSALLRLNPHSRTMLLASDNASQASKLSNISNSKGSILMLKNWRKKSKNKTSYKTYFLRTHEMRQQPSTCRSMEAGYQARSRWKSDATVSRLRDYLTWPDEMRAKLPRKLYKCCEFYSS